MQIPKSLHPTTKDTRPDMVALGGDTTQDTKPDMVALRGRYYTGYRTRYGSLREEILHKIQDHIW